MIDKKNIGKALIVLSIVTIIATTLSAKGLLPFAVSGGCKEFKTNVKNGNYGEENSWVALDVDNDGYLEVFGYSNRRSGLRSRCLGSYFGIKTPEGYDVMYYSKPDRVRICVPVDEKFIQYYYYEEDYLPEMPCTTEEEPKEEKICETGTYDPQTESCVVSPEVEIRCEIGVYDPQTESCVVSPEVEIIKCNKGVYNEVSGKCEYYAETEVLCQEGEYDETTKKCVVKPEVEVVCDVGKYDESRGKCVVEPETEIVCKTGNYDESEGKCVVEPEIKKVCETGEYDETLDACVVRVGFKPEILLYVSIAMFLIGVYLVIKK